MFDKDRALSLLGGATAQLTEALAKLDEIRKEDGEINNLKQKRNAVRRPLEDVEEALGNVRQIVAAAVLEPPLPLPGETETPAADSGGADSGATDTGATEPGVDAGEIDAGGAEPGATDSGTTDPGTTDAGGTDPGTTDSPPPEDLFSIEDQHAVSKLMQDSAVHLAVIRKRKFWEIRHRNTADGRPSEAIRAATIAEAYETYEQQAVRRSGFVPFEGRALTPEEQQALADFHAMPVDNPRSVRWEATMTEVDYIDKQRHHAGGKSDDVQFPPGELIGPVEHLKTVLS